MDRVQRLHDLYAAFNARDVDVALASMTADVDWPAAWEGGRVVGREAVRAYWLRQWAEVDSRAEAMDVTQRPDGTVEVRVHLIGRNADGAVVFDDEARHVYAFRGELVERMTIEPWKR